MNAVSVPLEACPHTSRIHFHRHSHWPLVSPLPCFRGTVLEVTLKLGSFPRTQQDPCFLQSVAGIWGVYFSFKKEYILSACVGFMWTSCMQLPMEERRGLKSLEIQLQELVNHLMRVIGSQSKSSIISKHSEVLSPFSISHWRHHEQWI